MPRSRNNRSVITDLIVSTDGIKMSKEERYLINHILQLPKSQKRKLLNTLTEAVSRHRGGDAGWRRPIILARANSIPVGKAYYALTQFMTCNAQYVYNLKYWLEK